MKTIVFHSNFPTSHWKIGVHFEGRNRSFGVAVFPTDTAETINRKFNDGIKWVFE